MLRCIIQAFVALANGEIKTFDLLCLRISQYVIPDLWKVHEEKSLSSGMSATDPSTSYVHPLASASQTSHTDIAYSGMVIDMAIHPRDLNLLFVAYEGSTNYFILASVDPPYFRSGCLDRSGENVPEELHTL